MGFLENHAVISKMGGILENGQQKATRRSLPSLLNLKLVKMHYVVWRHIREVDTFEVYI